ncbi:hypothetical protein BC833DRAFT_599692 [Globomyces pollinis-pini]|nr:hypothetical protein BC833DRAFT_599692 [Globomyces pollinis-pini]
MLKSFTGMILLCFGALIKTIQLESLSSTFLHLLRHICEFGYSLKILGWTPFLDLNVFKHETWTNFQLGIDGRGIN